MGTHPAVDEAARYDELAPWYDLAIAPVEWLIRRRRTRLLAGARGDVLEVGGGTGRTLRLYPPDCRITGIDPSEKMLERARRRGARVRLEVHVRHIAAEQLAFEDASFDTVSSSLTFCSVADPKRALAERRRVLRPYGQLLMIEHVRPPGRYLGRLFDRLDPWWYKRSCHLARRTPDDVRAGEFGVVEEQRWLKGALVAIRAQVEP